MQRALGPREGRCTVPMRSVHSTRAEQRVAQPQAACKYLSAVSHPRLVHLFRTCAVRVGRTRPVRASSAGFAPDPKQPAADSLSSSVSEAAAIATPTSSPAAGAPPAVASPTEPSASESPAAQAPPPPRNLLERVKRFFIGEKFDKQRLAELGLGAFAAYGVVSNLSYGVCVTIAWCIFVRSTGLTPFAPGQWAPFLAVYAGLWAVQNFLRPVRLSFAIAMAPVFDNFMNKLAARFKVKKQVAFFMMLLMIAAGTITFMVTAITIFGQVPKGVQPVAAA